MFVTPPDSICFSWETYQADPCDEQWTLWDNECSWWWTDMCQTVNDKWNYQAGVVFLDPTVPDDDCWYPETSNTEECWTQWDTVEAQCNGWWTTDFYNWTDVCDASELLWEFE